MSVKQKDKCLVAVHVHDNGLVEKDDSTMIHFVQNEPDALFSYMITTTSQRDVFRWDRVEFMIFPGTMITSRNIKTLAAWKQEVRRVQEIIRHIQDENFCDCRIRVIMRSNRTHKSMVRVAVFDDNTGQQLDVFEKQITFEKHLDQSLFRYLSKLYPDKSPAQWRKMEVVINRKHHSVGPNRQMTIENWKEKVDELQDTIQSSQDDVNYCDCDVSLFIDPRAITRHETSPGSKPAAKHKDKSHHINDPEMQQLLTDLRQFIHNKTSQKKSIKH